MKIGIFGGSFNPPHAMHTNMASELISKNFVDRIIFVPTGDKYSKQSLISADHRINMLNLLCEDNKLFSVSDFEVKNTLVSTYQTLDYFQSLNPNDKLYFILGSDNLKELHTWKNYEYIIKNYKILVIKRDNDNVLSIINNSFGKYSTNFLVADITLSNLSSTEIRAKLFNNSSISHVYLNPKVLAYITDNNLYKK